MKALEDLVAEQGISKAEFARNAISDLLYMRDAERFAAWLAAADVCLALTTYQAGRMFFIGRKDDGGIRALSAQMGMVSLTVTWSSFGPLKATPS